MKVKVKGAIRDLLAFRRLTSNRRRRFAAAVAEPLPTDPINLLARTLHPSLQHLVIAEVREETRSARSFLLIPDRQMGTERLAVFRAGQYISVREEVNGVQVTRPYSLSSAPFEALGDDGRYQITVRKKDGGFVTEHIWANWRPGTRVTTSGPVGLFYHDPLRDRSSIVGLAGGSGIAPFRSVARDIVHGDSQLSLVLFYGSSDEDDIIYYDELGSLESNSKKRVRVVHVLSCEEVSLAGCEQGFISADIIRRHADVRDCSVFVCGPRAMYRFVMGELRAMGLPERQIRIEAYGEMESALDDPAFPTGMADAHFTIRVQMGGGLYEIPAQARETILVALERANLAPPSQCRSGECGFCRSLLVAGEVHVPREKDGRRAADREHGFIHPCATYPLSDLEMVVPREG